MARPRIRQFADDLGIEYGKAKNLVSEGRRRKDGGSQILESNMNKMQTKVNKVAKGLKKASKTHAKQAKTLDSVEFRVGGTLRSALRKLKDKEPKNRNFLSYDTVKPRKPKRGRKKAMGGSTNVDASPQARGAGAAIRGTKFSGVY